MVTAKSVGKSVLPARRVIVLGASNVTRGLRTFCETAGGLWGEPLDVLAAIGHGRSYGVRTTVLGRGLPSILDCELWDDWQSRESLPSAAIITDIGNDIMYGSSPRQIADWVQTCASRVAEHCQRVVITGLPLESIQRLGPRRFRILRAILFPRSPMTLEVALGRAMELNERVREIASALHIECIAPDPSWFGVDPIHIRRRHWSAAWVRMLHPLRDAVENGCCNHQSANWRLRRLQAKHRWFFGVEQRRPQPVWHGPDGSQLSLY